MLSLSVFIIINNRPANNYGISASAIDLWKKLNITKTATLCFWKCIGYRKFL